MVKNTIIDHILICVDTFLLILSLNLTEASDYLLETTSLVGLTYGIVSKQMYNDMLKLVILFYECNYVNWMDNIIKNIYLWIDYVCLSQKIPEKCLNIIDNSFEDILFFETLKNLALLQKSMHALVVNTKDDYNKRAWCVAEWITADDDLSLTIMQSEFIASGSDRFTQLMDCIVLFLDPNIYECSEIIKKLELYIFDDPKYTYSKTVCNILWNAVCEYLKKKKKKK